ncbi:MAG: alginate export family protein [bacterium]
MITSMLLLLPSLCSGQTRAASGLPAYQPLRFEEDWNAIDRRATPAYKIKAIPLVPAITLTLGGQARWREEFVRGFMLTSSADRYGQSRVLLHADLRAGEATGAHARIFAEYRDAQSYERDLPGGTRPIDADRADVQNLFGDLAYRRSWLRAGRQEIELGRARLVGVPDWANTRQSMDGARAMLTFAGLAVDALAVRPVVVRLDAFNRADSAARLNSISIGSARGVPTDVRGMPVTWQLYWHEQSSTVASATHRLTTGGRAAATAPGNGGRSYGLEAEAAVQRGSSGAKQLRAWFWTLESQLRWRNALGTPTLAVGLEEASGDSDPGDDRLEAFNTLYASAHAHGGDADVLGRANARQFHAIVNWATVARVSLQSALYRFDRLVLADGAYTKQNSLLRAASGSNERHIADEVDLSGSVAATPQLKVIFGTAWVLPGEFLRATPGSAQRERWSYVGTTLTF